MPIDGLLYLRVAEPLTDAALADLRPKFIAGSGLDPVDDLRADGVTLVHEDNPYFLPGPLGHWYEANLIMPYYGPGYERGHLPLFLRCAEWLEAAVPGGEVWYGNDASDESIRPFGPAAREELRAYYERVGHDPYYSKFRQPQSTPNQALQQIPPPVGFLGWLNSLWRRSC